VRAAIRRADAPKVPDITGFDAIFVDFAKMEVMREDSPVILTATQFKILKFFVQNAERVISRDELLHLLGYNGFLQTIDNHILGLRHKLERDPANPVHFLTVRGDGFRFVP
jgi:DNA-binding response OmpR family regulator